MPWHHSLLFWELNSGIFTKTWVPFTQWYIAPRLVEISLVVLEKTIFEFPHCIFINSLQSPREKWSVPSFEKLESHSPKNAFYQVWLKLALWFWRKRFSNFVYEFLFFRYFPLEKTGPITCTNLNSHHQGMLCTKFGWNWSSGSREEDEENVKRLRLRWRQRQQRRRRTKLTWTFGSGELKLVDKDRRQLA